MSQQSILVTGATGNQGAGVVRHCLASASPPKIYALVRDPSSPKSQALEASGAHLIQGDLNDLASLESALSQTQPTAVFLNFPPGLPSTQIAQCKNMIAAAKTAPSIQQFFYSSAVATGKHESFPGWGPEHSMAEYWLGKHEMENLVRDAGFKSLTIVRLAFFLQLFVPPVSDMMFPELWSGKDGKGVLRAAFRPDAKCDLVDGGDVGAVVAKALESPADFEGKTIDLAVESLTMQELGAKIGKAKGREVEVICESAEEVAKVLGPRGPRLVAAQVLFSDLGPSVNVEKNREEFKMTSVADFFAKAEV